MDYHLLVDIIRDFARKIDSVVNDLLGFERLEVRFGTGVDQRLGTVVHNTDCLTSNC